MDKKDFYFELPKELIAQRPIEKREASRLLRMDRATGEMNHHHFYELPELLDEGDCLVLNDSRVMPARLLGERDAGGSVEVVLLREVERCEAEPHECNLKHGGATGGAADGATGGTIYECLVRPGRKCKPGTRLVFGNGELTALVTGVTDGGNRYIRYNCSGVFLDVLERLGKMPLPPYIHEELQDRERYQTVYSRETGSAAAPTAGLHFTGELLDTIKSHGVQLCYLTLHVGLGTFRPVKTDTVEEHRMHAEYYTLTADTAEAINQTKRRGGRVLAVGTTSCRTLESCADETGMLTAGSGSTDIFIYPGYRFKCIDGIITNFHLPESTLIMLVSALAGRENVLRAYEEAIRERYRFFSFGDAMLIL